MSTVRLRRLTADYAKLKEYVRLHPRIRLVQADGDPPERYQLEFRIKSIRMIDGELQDVKSHLVEIVLPRNYPRNTPQCRMLSPVFHPNIAPHAICVGDHWSSGEPLSSIVARIGELLAYQVYNVKSPLNGEAARWVEQNQDKLPLDSVSLLVEEETATQRSSPVPTIQHTEKTAANSTASTENPQAPPVTKVQNTESVACPSCQQRYRLREEMFGRDLRCIKCETTFKLPTQ
jgi:ubiquitin-protein ligase